VVLTEIIIAKNNVLLYKAAFTIFLQKNKEKIPYGNTVWDFVNYQTRQSAVPSAVRENLFSVYADASSAACDVFKLNLTVDESEQSIIGTAANIVAGMDVRTSLTKDDVAGDNVGTVSLLNAKTLGFAVTAVLSGTYTLLMSEEL